MTKGTRQQILEELLKLAPDELPTVGTFIDGMKAARRAQEATVAGQDRAPAVDSQLWSNLKQLTPRQRVYVETFVEGIHAFQRAREAVAGRPAPAIEYPRKRFSVKNLSEQERKEFYNYIMSLPKPGSRVRPSRSGGGEE